MRIIVVNQNIGQENLKWLAGKYPQFEFHMPLEDKAVYELAKEAEIIAGWADRDMIESAGLLRWFHSASAGVDHIIDDLDNLRGEDLLFSNSAGVYGVPISEHLLALMLSFAHRIGPSIHNMAESKWGGIPPCSEVYGSTVGIVGIGDIGRHLAALLQPFHCEVLAFKRSPSEKPEGVSQMLYGAQGLDELLRRSDYVCVCLPGTPDTRGLLDSRRLGLMKRNAVLLNIGRGYIIDTDAMTQALQSGTIAGAGLDVTEPEPLPPDHPLWKLPNVIITPHISGYTPPHWERRATEFFAQNLDAYIAGEKLPGLVDRLNRY